MMDFLTLRRMSSGLHVAAAPQGQRDRKTLVAKLLLVALLICTTPPAVAQPDQHSSVKTANGQDVTPAPRTAKPDKTLRGKRKLSPDEEKFARTGIRNAPAEICANPPCHPVCDTPPCPHTGGGPHAEEFHCSNCCQLKTPPTRVDLALFVVSLHHNQDDAHGVPPPTDSEVKAAAKSFKAIWESHPEKLVILMPAGPMIPSSLIPRTEAFRNELRDLYGYEFNYAVTGTPFCNLGALTQAVITGGDWPIGDAGCVTHHFPPDASGGPGYDTYGDFLIRSRTEQISFHILAAQTPGAGVNPALVSQLLYLSDSGKVPRGTEPTFVAGDFNWPNSNNAEITDFTLGPELKARANWLNCNQKCTKPAGTSVFVPTVDPPDKLQLFQLNGPTRLIPVGVQRDRTANVHLHLDNLAHLGVGVLFNVASTAQTVPKGCPP